MLNAERSRQFDRSYFNWLKIYLVSWTRCFFFGLCSWRSSDWVIKSPVQWWISQRKWLYVRTLECHQFSEIESQSLHFSLNSIFNQSINSKPFNEWNATTILLFFLLSSRYFDSCKNVCCLLFSWIAWSVLHFVLKVNSCSSWRPRLYHVCR